MQRKKLSRGNEIASRAHEIKKFLHVPSRAPYINALCAKVASVLCFLKILKRSRLLHEDLLCLTAVR